jgi:tetratricopeptide (TPR) repeat protein
MKTLCEAENSPSSDECFTFARVLEASYPRDALGWYLKSNLENIEDVHTLNNVGVLFLQDRKYDQALQYLEKAERRISNVIAANNNAKSSRRMTANRTTVLFNIARTHEYLNALEKASEIYKEILNNNQYPDGN